MPTSAKNFSIISPSVDAVLQQAPREFWDVFGVLCLVLGLVFAFFGHKLLRTQATFYSGCLAGGGSAFILHLIETSNEADGMVIDGGVWLGVVITVGVVVGYLVGRAVVLRTAVLWLVWCCALAALFNQYVLSYFDSLPEWVFWVVYACAALLSGVLMWWFSPVAVILATSFLGAFLVLLSSALLMDGDFSLTGMFGADAGSLMACTTIECWAPLLIGIAAFLLGARFQLYLRQRGHAQQNEEEGIKLNNGEGGEPSRVSVAPAPLPPPQPVDSNPFASAAAAGASSSSGGGGGIMSSLYGGSRRSSTNAYARAWRDDNDVEAASSSGGDVEMTKTQMAYT